MTRKLIISLLVFGLAGTANAISLSFSTDGSTPLPDGATIWPAPGSTTTVYILSDTSGAAGGYWTYLEMNLPNADASIPFGSLSIHANAGDTASVVDHSSGSLMDYLLTAADSAGGVVAGEHFAFDLVLGGAGPLDPFYFWNTVPSDGEYPEDKRVYVLPELGTIALLGLGSILLLRGRRRGGG
ncbi:MAG: hypothetical protein ACYSR4_00785 [Planctomycetota bacterium]